MLQIITLFWILGSTHCLLTSRSVAWQLRRLLKLLVPAKSVLFSFLFMSSSFVALLLALFCSRQEGLALWCCFSIIYITYWHMLCIESRFLITHLCPRFKIQHFSFFSNLSCGIFIMTRKYTAQAPRP